MMLNHSMLQTTHPHQFFCFLAFTIFSSNLSFTDFCLIYLNPHPHFRGLIHSAWQVKNMTSSCISNCVRDARVPVRATYVNLYKWPESDAEFVRSVSANANKGAQRLAAPREVDSISCRQIYLRSYTFSRKETVPEKTKKCFGKVKEKVGCRRKGKVGEGSRGSKDGGGSGAHSGGGRRKCMGMRRVKEISCAAFRSIFCSLLSCTSSVDVMDGRK